MLVRRTRGMVFSELEELREFIIRCLRHVQGDTRCLRHMSKRRVLTPQLTNPTESPLLPVMPPEQQRPKEPVEVTTTIDVGEVPFDPAVGIREESLLRLLPDVDRDRGHVLGLFLERGRKREGLPTNGDLSAVATHQREHRRRHSALACLELKVAIRPATSTDHRGAFSSRSSFSLSAARTYALNFTPCFAHITFSRRWNPSGAPT